MNAKIRLVLILTILLTSAFISQHNASNDIQDTITDNNSISDYGGDMGYNNPSLPSKSDSQLNEELPISVDPKSQLLTAGATTVNPQTIYSGETVRVDYQAKTNGIKDIQLFYDRLTFSFEFGQYGTGDGDFDTTSGIAIDHKNYVYVADFYNNRIQIFDDQGVYVSKFGTYGTGNGQFDHPRGMAFDSNGDLYVSDSQNHRIQKFTPEGTYISQFGTYGTGNGQFDYPEYITIDEDGYIYVLERVGQRVQKFNSAHTYQTKWGSFGTGDGQFNYPRTIAHDSLGSIYVGDGINDRVQRFSNTGTFQTKWGTSGTGDLNLDLPFVTVDPDDRVWVMDVNNDRLKVFDRDGTFEFSYGGSGSAPNEFGTGDHLAISSTGRLVIADGLYDKVKVWSRSKGVLQGVGLLPNANDGLTYDVVTQDDGWVIEESIYGEVTFYDMVNPAQAEMEYSVDVIQGGALQNVFTDQVTTRTLSSGAIYGSGEFKATIGFTGNSEGFTGYMSLYDTGTESYVTSTSTDTSALQWSSMKVRIDYIQADSLGVTSYPRSSYQYSTDGSTTIHTVEVETYDYRIPLAIYSPSEWVFSSISPNAVVVWDGTYSYYKVTNTVPLVYTIIFASDTTNILAIDDKSTDLIGCVDFECADYTTGWFNQPSYEWTVNKISSPVFSGNHALNLTGDGTYSSFSLKGLDAGYYYFSFSYWVSTSWSGAFNMRVYDGSAVQYALGVTPTNRWITAFKYFKLGTYHPSELWNFEFQTPTGSGSILIDNFRIYKASSTYSNVGLSEYDFVSHFMYWDGYQNPSATNINVNMVLKDRTGIDPYFQLAELKSWNLRTDNNGYATTTFRGELEMKEYLLEAYTIESDFGDYYATVLNDRADFTEDIDNFAVVGSWAETMTRQYGYLRIQASSTIATVLSYSLSVDTSKYKYLMFETWTNTESPSNYIYGIRENTVYFQVWSSHYPITHPTLEKQTIFTDLTDFSYSTTWSGTATQWAIIHNLPNPYYAYYDNFRLYSEGSISSMAFTPIPASYMLYPYVQKIDLTDNYFDYSEGVIDTQNPSSYTAREVVNGYYKIDINAGSHFWSNYEFIDSKDTTLVVRAKANISVNLLFELWTEPYSYNNIVGTASLTTNWQIFEFNLSGMSVDSDGNIVDFYTYLTSTIYLDYIYVVYKDTDYNKGAGWEFNENDYMDEWVDYTSPTTTVESGYISVLTDGDYDGIKLTMEQDLSNYDYVDIRIRSNDIATGNLYLYFYDGVTWKGNLLITLNSAFTVSTYQLSAGTKLADLLYIHVSTYGDYGTFEIDYIRAYTNADNGLYETEDYFYFQSETNNLYYYYELDGLHAYALDNQIIWKDKAIGDHSFSYSAIASVDPTEPRYDLVQLPTVFYFYDYTVIEEFQVQVQSFSLSDDYVQTYAVATKDYTYVVKENGTTIASGSGLATGTSIQTIRDTTLGVLIIYSVEFTNGTDTVTFTTSYSNADPITTYYTVHVSLVDGLGIGLPSETFPIYVNNSGNLIRVSNNFLWNNSWVDIVVQDYFGITLYTGNHTLTEGIMNYIDVVTPVFELSFTNPYELAVLVQIDRNGYTFQIVIPSNTTLSVKMTTGRYLITYTPVYDDPLYNDVYIGNEPPKLYAGYQEDYTHSELTLKSIELTTQRIDNSGLYTTSIWDSINEFTDRPIISALIKTVGLIGTILFVRRYGKTIMKKGFNKGTQEFADEN